MLYLIVEKVDFWTVYGVMLLIITSLNLTDGQLIHFPLLVLWFELFHVMLLIRLYAASCVLQVRGGAPLV